MGDTIGVSEGLFRGLRGTLAFYLLVCAMLTGLLLWRPTPAAIPDSLATTIDSLSESQPAFDSGVLVRLADAERRAARVTGLQEAARTAQREAQTQRTRADSLALLAASSPQPDTVWKAAHDARAEEALAWETRGDSLSLALAHATARGDSLQVVADMALVRLATTADALTDLRAHVTNLTSGCRIGPRFASLPCPSRRQAYVGGVVTGLAVFVAIRRKK